LCWLSVCVCCQYVLAVSMCWLSARVVCQHVFAVSMCSLSVCVGCQDVFTVSRFTFCLAYELGGGERVVMSYDNRRPTSATEITVSVVILLARANWVVVLWG
ncbi:hypothetical protein LSAT2_011849, partial [Lamellibrachia satsuma]